MGKHFIVRCKGIDMHSYARFHRISSFVVFFCSSVENAQREILANMRAGVRCPIYLHIPTFDKDQIFRLAADGFEEVSCTHNQSCRASF